MLNFLKQVFIAAAAALATYYLSQLVLSPSLQLNSVFASGFVGLIFAILLPGQSKIAFAGSFIGMTSPQVIANQPAMLIVAALLAVILFRVTKNLTVGTGGKLGALAFFSIVVVTAIANSFSIGERMFAYENLPLITLLGYLFAAVIGVLATLLARKIITKATGHDNPVLASAIIGGYAGLAAVIFPGFSALSALIYIASFVGMTDLNPFRHQVELAFAAALSVPIYLLLLTFTPAWGGRMGFSAFLSVLIVLQLLPRLWRILSNPYFLHNQSFLRDGRYPLQKHD